MLDPTFIISTPRLTISHLNPSNEQHVDHVYALNPTAYADREAARAFIQQRVKMMETIGYGRYLISLTPEGESMRGNNFPADANGRKLIGIVAVQLARFPNGPKVPDLGFAVLPEHRGKGYATEAAERVLQYYRDTKGCTAFAGVCDPKNEASMKMFRKLGFVERGVRDLKGMVGEDAVYTNFVWTLGVTDGKEALEACCL